MNFHENETEWPSFPYKSTSLLIVWDEFVVNATSILNACQRKLRYYLHLLWTGEPSFIQTTSGTGFPWTWQWNRMVLAAGNKTVSGFSRNFGAVCTFNATAVCWMLLAFMALQIYDPDWFCVMFLRSSKLYPFLVWLKKNSLSKNRNKASLESSNNRLLLRKGRY